jgi:hypothetical protein
LQHGAELVSGSVEPINGAAALPASPILDRCHFGHGDCSTTDHLRPRVVVHPRGLSMKRPSVRTFKMPVRTKRHGVRIDRQRCRHDLARSLFHAGCVVINDMIVPTADPRVPFGGRGNERLRHDAGRSRTAGDDSAESDRSRLAAGSSRICSAPTPQPTPT